MLKYLIYEQKTLKKLEKLFKKYKFFIILLTGVFIIGIIANILYSQYLTTIKTETAVAFENRNMDVIKKNNIELFNFLNLNIAIETNDLKKSNHPLISYYDFIENIKIENDVEKYLLKNSSSLDDLLLLETSLYHMSNNKTEKAAELLNKIKDENLKIIVNELNKYIIVEMKLKKEL